MKLPEGGQDDTHLYGYEKYAALYFLYELYSDRQAGKGGQAVPHEQGQGTRLRADTYRRHC